jgi:hypothetical protein
MRISDDGNVGIGTTDPVSKLHVAGQISIPANTPLNFNNGATAGGNFSIRAENSALRFNVGSDTENMILNSSGYLGIGTTNPIYNLDVNGNINANTDIHANLGNFLTGGIGQYFGIDSNSHYIPRKNATTGSLLNSDKGYYINLDSNNDDADTSIFRISKNTNDTSGGTELLRFTESGNLGLGTTDPGYALDVNGTVNINTDLRVNGTIYTGTLGTHNYKNGDTIIDTQTGYGIALQVGGAEKVRIDQSGNIGIGTTSPTSLLTISGMQSGAGTNLVIDGSGNVYISSSSRKFKDNIEDMTVDFAKILELEPKTFTYKSTGQTDIGYIAEDLVELGLTDLVNYGTDGLPTSIKYERITLYTVELLKQQQAQIDDILLTLEQLTSATASADVRAIRESPLQNDGIATLSAQLAMLTSELNTLKSDVLGINSEESPASTQSGSPFLRETGSMPSELLPDTATLSGVLLFGEKSIYDSTASTSALPVITNAINDFALFTDSGIHFVNKLVTIDLNGNIILKNGVLVGNNQMRGIETVPQGETTIVVERNWATPPYAVTVTPQFDSYVWVENINPGGFTVRVKSPPTSGNNQFTWIAMW